VSEAAWWVVAWACGDRWLMSAYRSAGQGGVVFVRFDFDAVLDGSCVDDGARNTLEELGERVDVVAGGVVAQRGIGAGAGGQAVCALVVVAGGACIGLGQIARVAHVAFVKFSLNPTTITGKQKDRETVMKREKKR
jgi:hypothetical protein